MTTPEVTVVVPTYRRADRLESLVAALEQQSLAQEAFEVVIVDDGSDDGTPEVLERLRAGTPLDLRVERLAVNQGAARARNVGADKARAPILAFTDDDCRPDPGWLSAGLEAFADDDTHVVQGRTEPDEVSGPWAATRDITAFSGIYEACNIFYRADAFRAAGGFDEELGWFCEDTAVGVAVTAAGGRAAFAPRALVFHDVSYPGLGWWIRHAWLHQHWNVLVHRYPHLRDELLWRRLFFRRRHVLVLAGLAGVALTPASPWFLALAAPWTIRRGPRKPSLRGIVEGAKRMGMDVAVEASLIVGSVRERCLVL